MQIDCGHFHIRSWRVEDEPALVRHANNPRVPEFLRDRFPYPYTRENAQHWLATTMSQRPETNFAIEYGGEAVGGIGLIMGSDIERCQAELGYWLGESVWGKGIGTAAVRIMTEYAFKNFELTRVFAITFVDNLASIRVLEKSGFEREALMRRSAIKNGVIHDQFLYSITR